MKKIIWTAVLIGAAYLLLWPVTVEPVAWDAPENPCYTGAFTANDRLRAISLIPLTDNHGPEDIAIDENGNLYAATGEGNILRFSPEGQNQQVWARTGGRPLGIEFDAAGNLLVADAYKGLLSIDPAGQIKLLTNEVDGTPILYADDVDIAPNGVIYFSDASTRFGAEANGGTYPASLLDLMEHSRAGRLLAYDPATEQTSVILSDLQFANGAAVDPAGQFVLVNETGTYSVTKVWLEGDKAGSHEVIISNMPGFPDNISAGQNGRFWLGLVSPRAAALDTLSDAPFLRKIVQRLPASLRPKAVAYGHVVAIDENGTVLHSLQDSETHQPMATGVTETDDKLFISSLTATTIGVLNKKDVGID